MPQPSEPHQPNQGISSNSAGMSKAEAELALNYYKQLADQMAGLAIKTDAIIAATKHHLRQKQQALSLLSVLHRLIRTQMDADTVFSLTVDKVNSMLNMDCTVIFTPSETVTSEEQSTIHARFAPVCWLGLSEKVVQAIEQNSKPLTIDFQALISADTDYLLVNRQTPQTELIASLQETLQVPYFVCLPIVINEHVEGILLSGRLKETKPFYPPLDSGDVDTFQAIAGFISAALTNSKLYNNVEELEQRYYSIFENALKGIFQSTPDGRFLNANPALARMYGYSSADELMQQVTNIDEQLYVERSNRQAFEAQMSAKAQVKGFICRFYRQDGRIIWVQIDARSVKDSRGRVIYYEGIVQDITERKQIEDRLRQQLEELQIEIDQQQRDEEVATVTNSGYFQTLQQEIENIDLDDFWA